MAFFPDKLWHISRSKQGWPLCLLLPSFFVRLHRCRHRWQRPLPAAFRRKKKRGRAIEARDNVGTLCLESFEIRTSIFLQFTQILCVGFAIFFFYSLEILFFFCLKSGQSFGVKHFSRLFICKRCIFKSIVIFVRDFWLGTSLAFFLPLLLVLPPLLFNGFVCKVQRGRRVACLPCLPCLPAWMCEQCRWGGFLVFFVCVCVSVARWAALYPNLFYSRVSVVYIM